MRLFAAALLGMMMACSHAAWAASDPVLAGTFGDWKVYSFDDGQGKVCFMSSQPQKQEGNFKKRGEVALFVTHWSSDKTKNVVSLSAGYPYKDKSKAAVTVDGKTHELFTQGEMAWADNQAADDAIVDSLRKGKSLVVKGTSKKGTLTTDTYSLKGSADAYAALNRECNF